MDVCSRASAQPVSDAQDVQNGNGEAGGARCGGSEAEALFFYTIRPYLIQGRSACGGRIWEYSLVFPGVLWDSLGIPDTCARFCTFQ